MHVHKNGELDNNFRLNYLVESDKWGLEIS